MQRNDDRAPDENSPDQFRVERGTARERFGACLAGKNVCDLRVMIEEGVPRWMKEQG